MCPFGLLRDSVRMENAIRPLYSNVSWQFYVFLKTESSHTRACTFRNMIFHDFPGNREMHESVYIYARWGGHRLWVAVGRQKCQIVTLFEVKKCVRLHFCVIQRGWKTPRNVTIVTFYWNTAIHEKQKSRARVRELYEIQVFRKSRNSTKRYYSNVSWRFLVKWDD